jgi:hypothetical protein
LVSSGLALAGVTFIGRLSADNDRPSHHFKFVPNSLVLSRSVYVGTAETVTIGETLPRGWNTAASTSTSLPFGIWFADANTRYMCDEGDGTLVSPAVNGSVEDAQSLHIGVPYSVPNYPASLHPATGGCRNVTGRHNHDGTVTIFAITSTISANRDQGADPNKLAKVRACSRAPVCNRTVASTMVMGRSGIS